jgi:hypothetical protein
LSTANNELKKYKDVVGGKMPVNTGKNRALDCAVIQYIRQANKINNDLEYDTVRCAFAEGELAFPDSHIIINSIASN